MKKLGKAYYNRVTLEPHEREAVRVLIRAGYTISLVPPSSLDGRKTPDFNMNGLFWELKSPRYSKSSTLEHIFKKAGKQAENVIFYLGRVQGQTRIILKRLKFLFLHSRRVKRLIVISKTEILSQFDKTS